MRRFRRVVWTAGFSAVLFPTFFSQAQNQPSPTYPYISPTAAASGMTQGIENGATSTSITMMQVRAAAHDAERAAAAAAMARAAESAIEEENHQAALEHARQVRYHKMEAAERLKWERATAYNAYNGVSQGEMSTWKDQQGNIKIGRGLPPEFVAAMQEQEAADAADAEAAKKKGFAPLKKLGERVNSVISDNDPYQETGLASPKPLPRDVPASASLPPNAPRERPKVLNFNPPKIRPPKFLSKRDSELPMETPQFSEAAPPAPITASPSAPAVAAAQVQSAPVATPVAAPVASVSKKIPARSGANLIQPSDIPPDASVQKSNPLFSRSQPTPSGEAEKRFGFGKKNKDPQTDATMISSSLFPSAPTIQPASSSPPRSLVALKPEINLPESNATASTGLKKFNLPKPNFGSLQPTPVNQQVNAFYTVESSSQFMKQSPDQSRTTISALPPGTVVMVTKTGSDWAGVRLADGSTGVIDAKHLRAANSGEVSSFSR